MIIWNEEVHTFESIGYNRFTHYVRPRVVDSLFGKARMSVPADDKVGEPRFMTGAEVDAWIKARTREPITEAEAQEFIRTWESGNFGPLDNPSKDDPGPRDPLSK